MKRVYKNKLPKDMEVNNTNIRIENGELIIDVEFKKKLQPKDGDFLVSRLEGTFIYSNKKATNASTYSCYCGEFDGEIFTEFSDSWTPKTDCRYATIEEKEAFLEKLEKEYNKKWNAEKKCLEDAYIPKFGDIIRIEHPDCNLYKRNYVISIFPDKEIPNKSDNKFFDIASINMDEELTIGGTANYNYGHVYPASDSEKQELFKKLEKEGKRWNPKTKQLEDIRWKPKDGDMYYFMDLDYSIAYTRFSDGSFIDSKRVEANNCFKTEEVTQFYAEQIKEILKNSKAY